MTSAAAYLLKQAASSVATRPDGSNPAQQCPGMSPPAPNRVKPSKVETEIPDNFHPETGSLLTLSPYVQVHHAMNDLPFPTG